jgi:hypothetical protein
LNEINKKLLNLNFDNGQELMIFLDHRKNLINIPTERYESFSPNDLILCLYNRFIPITYIHFIINDDSLSIENIKTNEKYENKGYCKLLLSIIILLSRLINENVNMIHFDSINDRISYLSVFVFDAIPQIEYYNLRETDLYDKKDEIKCKEFTDKINSINKNDENDATYGMNGINGIGETKIFKYGFIQYLSKEYGNDLFLVIEINDLFIDKIQKLLSTLL